MKASRRRAAAEDMGGLGDPVEDEDDSPSQDMAGGPRPANKRSV